MLTKSKIYSEELLIRELPKNINPKDLEYFENEISKKISKNYIYTIKNVKIFNYYLIKLTSFNQILNLSLFQKREIIRKVKILIKYYLRKTKPINIDTGYFITDNKSSNFFHWYLDSVPRLIEVKERFPELTLLLPKNISNQTYVKQFCSLFDINYREIDKDKTYKINTLISVNNLAPSGNFRPKNLLKLTSLFRSYSTDKSEKTRIWISRQNSKTKIENFTEVSELLKTFNIEVVDLESLSLIEQVKLFRSIEFVGGLHGAGFTNLIHCKNTKVLEVRNQSNKDRNCYFSLCSDLGLEYFYFLSCKFEKQDEYIYTTRLNVNKLKKTLTDLFEES